MIPVRIEDTSMEIYARIARAEAQKFDCSIDIDFSDTNRNISLVGDKSNVPHIMEEVKNIFMR